MASQPARRTFRAPSGIVVMIASAIVAVFLLGDAVLRAGILSGLLLAPWVLLALWFAYVFVYISCVQTDAAGMRLRNLLRIVDVPWRQISDIDLSWQLRVRLVDGTTVRSFGGPVAGRPGRPALRTDRESRPTTPPAVRDLELIREQWEAATEFRAGDSERPGVRRSWDLRALAALAVIAVWAVIAVLITGGPS